MAYGPQAANCYTECWKWNREYGLVSHACKQGWHMRANAGS